MSSITQKDLITAPSSKIVYNAPFSEKNVYNVLVNFQGTRRIGWAIKTTNAKRLNVHPPCGVLDPRENIMLKVTQDQFDYGSEDTNNDRITIEFTEAPAGASKEFRREWFQGDGAVYRKNLPIEYNV